jgi:hypothetical protein
MVAYFERASSRFVRVAPFVREPLVGNVALCGQH